MTFYHSNSEPQVSILDQASFVLNQQWLNSVFITWISISNNLVSILASYILKVVINFSPDYNWTHPRVCWINLSAEKD